MPVLELLDARRRLPERPRGRFGTTRRLLGVAVAFARLDVAAMLFIRLPRFSGPRS